MNQKTEIRASAEINLDIATENMKLISELVHPAGVMAVVKADGYGHGAVRCAQAFAEGGASWLAVATVDEAIELQDAGLELPLLILGLVEEAREMEVLERGIRIVVADKKTGLRVAAKADKLGRSCPIHIKLDTGMSRIGFEANEAGCTEILDLASEVDGSLQFEGLMTHFARSDEDDRSVTDEQYKQFAECKERLERAGIVPAYSHVCNSAATVRFPEYHLDLVRVGLIAYGMFRSNVQEIEGLHPVMNFKSRVVFVKNLEAGRGIGYGHINVTQEPRRIATVSVGYADGYKRDLGGKGHVSIGGKLYPVVGRVCMDALMVDVGPADPMDGECDIDLTVSVGDEVLLWGQSGRDRVRVEDLADLLNTIPYELTCGVMKRVPRICTKKPSGFSETIPREEN